MPDRRVGDRRVILPCGGQDLAALTQARSLLVLLLATCQQTLLALEAAANHLDTDMTEDLTRMITRSERELDVLDARIATVAG